MTTARKQKKSIPASNHVHDTIDTAKSEELSTKDGNNIHKRCYHRFLSFLNFTFTSLLLLTMILMCVWVVNRLVDLPPEVIVILYILIITPCLLYILNFILFRERQKIDKVRANINLNEPVEKKELETNDQLSQRSGVKDDKIYSRPITSFLISNRNKHFTGLITLIVFYLSFIIGIAIFKPKESITLVPNLKAGTFGLRAWRCRVIVKDLKVTYDSSNVWREIPNSILYNPNNWKLPMWYKWDKGKNSPYDYFAKFDTISKEFILKNCAAFFYPPASVFKKVFGNIRISGSVSYWYPDNDGFFPGFQFILHVDTTLVYTPIEGKTFSDLCLQYNLNISGEAHPWIPALDWEPVSLYKSSIKGLLLYGGIFGKLKVSTKIKPQWYQISGIWFDDQILFLSHNYGSCKLFETKVYRNSTFLNADH